MTSFYDALIDMKAKDKERFVDAEGGHWVYYADDTGCMVKKFDSSDKLIVKYTQEHLAHCCAPEGFSKIMGTAEQLEHLSQSLEKIQGLVGSIRTSLK